VHLLHVLGGHWKLLGASGSGAIWSLLEASGAIWSLLVVSSGRGAATLAASPLLLQHHTTGTAPLRLVLGLQGPLLAAAGC
jgi:hypothetical protein